MHHNLCKFNFYITFFISSANKSCNLFTDKIKLKENSISDNFFTWLNFLTYISWTSIKRVKPHGNSFKTTSSSLEIPVNLIFRERFISRGQAIKLRWSDLRRVGDVLVVHHVSIVTEKPLVRIIWKHGFLLYSILHKNYIRPNSMSETVFAAQPISSIY